jgi:hypothetical protein
MIGGAEKLLTDFDCPIDIAPEQLAGVFLNIYFNRFSHENMIRSLAMDKQSPGSIKLSGIIHYHRRSFVEILGVVKRRVITDWDSTMNMLHSKIQNDRTGMSFYQDLCCQLHLLGVFTVKWMTPHKIQEVYLSRFEWPLVFRDWKMLPQNVCVVLVIPRARLQPLLPALDQVGTPALQCDVEGVTTSSTFSCINAVFGTVKIDGKGDGKIVDIKEDPARRYGTSPLVVWFWVLSVVILNEH